MADIAALSWLDISVATDGGEEDVSAARCSMLTVGHWQEACWRHPCVDVYQTGACHIL